MLCDALRRAGCVADRFPHAFRVWQAPQVVVHLRQSLWATRRLLSPGQVRGVLGVHTHTLARTDGNSMRSRGQSPSDARYLME